MKLSTVQGELADALRAAPWTTEADAAVLVEGDGSDQQFGQAIERGLHKSGCVLVVMPPAASQEAAVANGGRIQMKATCVVALLSRGSSQIQQVGQRLEQVIQTVMQTTGHNLEAVDFGRVAEEEAALCYYIAFDIRVLVTASK